MGMAANPSAVAGAGVPPAGPAMRGMGNGMGGKGGANGVAQARNGAGVRNVDNSIPVAQAGAFRVGGDGQVVQGQGTGGNGGNGGNGMGGGSVYDQSARAYQQALNGPNINRFMNPYQREVIDRSMADLNRQQNMAMNQLGQQASAAGAFGGSRHGVAEALTNQNFTQQMADTSAQLRQQGFNTALGAAQNQQQMQSQLAQQGFNMGQALTQQQMQQGALQQASQQALIDAGKAQFAGFTGSPQQTLQTMLAAVGAGNMGQQTQTTQSNPGIWGILGGLASLAAL